MKAILSTLAILQMMMIFSCTMVQGQFIKGDGNVTDSERTISNFSYIEVSDGIDLYLLQSNTNELEIEADQNLHQYIVTTVEGDVLKIYLSKSIIKSKSLKVYLKITDIKGLSASGGSDVETKGSLKLDDFSAICSGGSDIRMEIDAKELKFKASGGSDGYLRGKVNTFKGMASGGSDILAYELETSECMVEVSGGSDAEVYTKGNLIARGSGGSDVSYKGNPTNIDSNMSGGSDLSSQ